MVVNCPLPRTAPHFSMLAETKTVTGLEIAVAMGWTERHVTQIGKKESKLPFTLVAAQEHAYPPLNSNLIDLFTR